MFGALGTMSYGPREIARFRDDVTKRSVLFWEIELMTVVTSAVCMAVWIGWILFNTRYRIYYIVLSMGILATMFDISWFFNGLEQFKYTVTKNAAFKLIGVALLFAFVHSKDDLLKYVFILTLSTMAGNLSMWMYVGRFTEKVDFRSLRIGRHFRETLIYFVPSIATSVYTVLDKILIGAITHDELENGYYEQATKMINMMKALTFTSLNSVLGARIAYLFEEEKYEEIHDRIRTSANYILFMGVGICFGLISVARRFVPVFYGPGFDRVADMLIMMSPLTLIIGISNCLGSQYYTPSGRRGLSARFIVAGSCLNLCMNLLLIPRMKGIGAIWGSLIAEILITVLYMIFCNGYLTVRILVTDGWKKLLAGVLMWAAIFFMDRFISSNFAALCIEVAAGGMLYILLLILLRDRFLMEFVFGRILGGVIRKIRGKIGK